MYKELIITSKKKQELENLLRLRHQSLLVHSRPKLVHVYLLLYDDIYSVRIWRISFRRVWYMYQIQEHRVRCASGVQHRRQARNVLNLTLSSG